MGGLSLFFLNNKMSPSLAFSKALDLRQVTWRVRLSSFPGKLHLFAFIFFSLAFIDPHVLTPRAGRGQNNVFPLSSIPTEGLAIYLALDRSGSMAEPVEGGISKIDLLKRVTQQFILNHPSDLIGLVSFARVPQVLAPLTLDHGALLRQLNQIESVKRSDEDGTAIGYAIYKTANLVSTTRRFVNDPEQKGKPPYTIKGAVVIVVTDGFQDPSRLDWGNRLRTLELDDAAAFSKNENVRLYVINIDPSLSTQQYAPQRRQLQRITDLTGGKFYLVSDSQALEDIYREIDRLEKGRIEQKVQVLSKDEKVDYHRYSLYPFFIAMGLLSLLLSLVLEMAVLRRVP